MKTILFITTSAKKMAGELTGVWFEELSTPYYILLDKGFEVEIASPKGGKMPFAPGSIDEEDVIKSVKRFRKDKFAMNKIRNTKLLSRVRLNKYDAIFFPGGHGAVVDLPEDRSIAKKLGEFFESGKPVAAVCHGPGGIVSAKKANGDSIVKGKKVTCFTNSEEVAAGADKKVPFLLESRLKQLGGKFVSGKDFGEFAVRDGNLITGQNPASSKKCAELLLEALSES